MTLAFATSSKTLSDEIPNLMPFHIDYTGPAPISTYFLAKESSPMTTSTTPLGSIKRVFSAAFRGRVIHGISTMLPRGYSGLALHIDYNGGSSSAASQSNKSSKRARDGSPTKSKKRAKDSLATSSKNQRRTRSAHAKDEPEDNAMETEEGSYAMMSEVIVEDHAVQHHTPMTAESVPTLRFMTPVGAFDSINVWHQDMPLDEGRDEYIRALDEWTRLAQVVRPRSTCSFQCIINLSLHPQIHSCT